MSDKNQTALDHFADHENPYYAIAIVIPTRYMINLLSSNDLTEKANWAQARAEVRIVQGRKLSNDLPLASILESAGMVLTPIGNPLNETQYALAASDGTTAIIYDRSTLYSDENGNISTNPLWKLEAHNSKARTIGEFIQYHGVNTELDQQKWIS